MKDISMNRSSANVHLRSAKPSTIKCAITLVVLIASMSITSAQTIGNRLYIRFNDATPTDYEGLRIRYNADESGYYVLGREVSTGSNFPTNIAMARIPANSQNNPLHYHYFGANLESYGTVGSPSDFWVDANDYSLISAIRSRLCNGCVPDKLSLVSVDNNLILAPTYSFDYGMINNTIKQGSAILLDATATQSQYVVPFNAYNPNIPQTVMKWGICAIDASNLSNVFWSHTWQYGSPSTHEDVRDICQVLRGPNGLYGVCGSRVNPSNGQIQGLVAIVDEAGNLVWQRAYAPPTGQNAVFNSIHQQVSGTSIC